MTLTTLIAIFGAGIVALGFIAYQLQAATIAEVKKNEAARKVYL